MRVRWAVLFPPVNSPIIAVIFSLGSSRISDNAISFQKVLSVAFMKNSALIICKCWSHIYFKLFFSPEQVRQGVFVS